VIKISIHRDTESIEVFAAGNDPGDITGLLAEIGRNLARQFEGFDRVQPVFNIHIKDSVVQRSNLLSFCKIDGTCGGDVVIEDAYVQRSNIAAGNVVRLRDGGGEAEQRAREEAERKEREEQERLWKEREERERIQREEEEKKERERRAGEEREKKAREEAERRGREEQERLRMEEEERLRKKREEQKKLAEHSNSIGMKFTLIPAGEFMMGLKENVWEQPVHKVKVNKPFYLGTYPVTQREWKAIMGDNPSYFKGDDLPVEQVSWDDVQKFIRKLNKKEGTDKYRLPSEAEWEYACRAGTTTRYSFGDSESKLGDYAWYRDHSGSKTHPVGKKKPNPYGLYDMHGNVREWVPDTWHGSYNGAPADGSAWESGGGSYRVDRGGGWRSFDNHCRSASRSNVVPGDRLNDFGFRMLEEL